MKCYYSHSRADYATWQEGYDIALLETTGFDVVNPSDQEHQRLSQGDMGYFLQLVTECDLLAFHAMTDGGISWGVSKEIDIANARRMLVFELPPRLNGTGISKFFHRYLTHEQTAERYSAIGKAGLLTEQEKAFL